MSGRVLFTAVRSEGGLLPGDLLARVVEGDDRRLEGLNPTDYGLLPHEHLGDAISRSWVRLVGAWRHFRDGLERLPEHDRGTTHTRERWLIPLFDELHYGRLATSKAIEAGGRTFAISHMAGAVPIHLVSARVELDTSKRGVAGATYSAPHGLLQDLLNRSPDHLWGILSNGLELRILRDNHRLTRQAYVSFDLEQMFQGELYSEFRLLWLVCHASRVRVEQDGPEGCWLERWFRAAREEGAQALDRLRRGVEEAIAHLGSGFLLYRGNSALRERLASRGLSREDYYRQLLRLVYRLIFLFVAEDRGLLLDPKASPETKERYARYYSTRRLRGLADRLRGGPHGDLWEMLKRLMLCLRSGDARLGLPGLGSFLWGDKATPDLDGAGLCNEHLLAAVRSLNTLEEGGVRRTVAWSLLAADELGGIYESLMELHPVLNKEAGTFALEMAAGHERKKTGAYYTPTALVDCLLDSALEPVLDAAARKGTKEEAEEAILELKIVDPACGSGHFLVAAARRVAARLARVRTEDLEPSPPEVQRALRDVVSRCIYGVDRNPMAVELCQVALWMEALDPGRPLSFLGSHIKVGNALLGATPAVLANGVPNEAWLPITGDDPKAASALKKRNAKERGKQLDLLAAYARKSVGPPPDEQSMALHVDRASDDSLEDVARKEAAWRALTGSPASRHARLVADLWCSAFVWKKRTGEHEAGAPTFELFRRVVEDASACPPFTRLEVKALWRQYRFFHWHLEFPAVFDETRGEPSKETGWPGGFDVVLGNPPWERIKLQEKEWFATRAPDVAGAPNAAARKRAIEALRDRDPELLEAWLEALRTADGESYLVRNSELYQLCGRGDINTYAIFAELNRALLGGKGRAGFIVPSGIATDATTQFYFKSIMSEGRLVSMYSFWEIRRIFVGTDSRDPFALMTLTGRETATPSAVFAFNLHAVDEIFNPERLFGLSAKDLALLNPNTRTCPVFRSRRDAEITKGIYLRIPILIREEEGMVENPWQLNLRAMFHMANDSGLFHTEAQLRKEGWRRDGNIFTMGGLRMLPLYEAKMIHQFDHRFGDYLDKPAGSESTALPSVPPGRLQDPCYIITPRYWVAETEVDVRLEGYGGGDWLLGWRDVCRSTDLRTIIGTVIPKAAVNHKYPLIFLPAKPAALAATLSSFVFDYCARQKLGGTSLGNFVLKQLPAPPPATYDKPCPWSLELLEEWFRPRVLELTYTAWDLEPFARDMGWGGPPFKWDEERRFWLRAELDAAYFHLYGICRDDAAYILDSFWIVRERDEGKYHSYRTKDAILKLYDQMESARSNGQTYQTVLSPPPADPSVAHPPRTEETP